MVSTLHASNCHTHTWQEVLVLAPSHGEGDRQVSQGYPVTEPGLKPRLLAPEPMHFPPCAGPPVGFHAEAGLIHPHISQRNPATYP